jgi:hypothetical protein
MENRSVQHGFHTKGESMKKNTVLKVVNPLLGILLINQVLMGLLHDRLPAEAFEVLHEGAGIVVAIVAVVHVILNWNWFKMNLFRKASKRSASQRMPGGR